MGFLATAIPIATAVLGAMGDKGKGQPQPQAPQKPSLGEIFAMNASNYRPQFGPQSPSTLPSQVGPVGPNIRGYNG